MNCIKCFCDAECVAGTILSPSHQVTTQPTHGPGSRLLPSHPVWFNTCLGPRYPSWIINHTVTLTLYTVTHIILETTLGERFYHHPHLQMRKLRHQDVSPPQSLTLEALTQAVSSKVSILASQL